MSEPVTNLIHNTVQDFKTNIQHSKKDMLLKFVSKGIESLKFSAFFGHFDLVVLRLNVPVNNFSVMSGRSHRFLGN